jgi:hypothetical protein
VRLAASDTKQREVFQMPNQVTAHNAGWPSQFRFADNVFWSGGCEFHR